MKAEELKFMYKGTEVRVNRQLASALLSLYDAVRQSDTEQDLPVATALSAVYEVLPSGNSGDSGDTMKPDIDDSPETIRKYLLRNFSWLHDGPGKLTLTYMGRNESGMRVFHIWSDRGTFAKVGYNQYGETQWFKDTLTWPFLDKPEVRRQLYEHLFKEKP